MQDSITISCEISNSDPQAKLGLEIWVDNSCVLDLAHVQNLTEFSQAIPDSENNHTLMFVLKGKTGAHTQLSSDGQIVKDARLHIKNICFDQVQVDQIFFDRAEYQHDFNGTAQTTQEKFYGELGCNGTVKMNFSTPVYLWLLENM
jgi:hypothetical protein